MNLWTVARPADFELAEYHALGQARRDGAVLNWGMWFGFFQLRLSPMMAILNVSLEPGNFQISLLQLHPNSLYRQCRPKPDHFEPPTGVPDSAFDRVLCLNTLEHLSPVDREALLAEVARKLRPGGLLIVSCELPSGQLLADLAALPGFNPEDRGRDDADRPLTATELVGICGRHGLRPVATSSGIDSDDSVVDGRHKFGESAHVAVGALFVKGEVWEPPAAQKVVLSVLTWNTREVSVESVRALIEDARLLRRLEYDPVIVVCDNGSTDGTAEALRDLGAAADVPFLGLYNKQNLGISIARNRIIDEAHRLDADYLFFLDGDVETIPFSCHAMIRYLEDSGHLVGGIGTALLLCEPERLLTTPSLFSIHPRHVERAPANVLTHYAMYRMEVFSSGVRFDESEPFDKPGWGYEDIDLGYQLLCRKYRTNQIMNVRYLHRYPQSSMDVMRGQGLDPHPMIVRRREYLRLKWGTTPGICDGPLLHLS